MSDKDNGAATLQEHDEQSALAEWSRERIRSACETYAQEYDLEFVWNERTDRLVLRTREDSPQQYGSSIDAREVLQRGEHALFPWWQRVWADLENMHTAGVEHDDPKQKARATADVLTELARRAKG